MFDLLFGAAVGYIISFPAAWLINRYAPESWLKD